MKTCKDCEYFNSYKVNGTVVFECMKGNFKTFHNAIEFKICNKFN